MKAFEEAGFYGVEILSRDERPWQSVEGIEFRALTVRAFKGKEGPCLERHQGVIYKVHATTPLGEDVGLV